MTNKKNNDSFRVFHRFAPFIQEYIYSKGWSSFREVQIQAADLIFSDTCHLLITSETSSGKTEAALFPLLSMMQEEGADKIQILYISPLKALINDQFLRMEELLEKSYLPIYRWHGDASQSQKNAFLKDPKGILQITPESLESLVLRKANDIPRIFQNLKFIIVDEIHSFLGSDRGNQILCLIQRISRMIGSDPRRIALSATIGNPLDALQWLSGGSKRESKAIQIPIHDLSWKLGFFHFTKDSKKNDDPADHFIYRATKGENCIVFSNSREETEKITANLKRIAKTKNEADRFYIHHANLSPSIRKDTESILKNSKENITVCATNSLELGIDIGQLKRIINRGAPFSVSSFLQRIGRSGRREEKPEMALVFQEEKLSSNAPFFQKIPWEMLQGIAIVELYRTERWIEPTQSKYFPASLLFHQTLSVLAQKAGLPVPILAKEILTLAPFQNVKKDDYRELLLHMIQEKYLELTEEKELLVGEKGEHLIFNHRFLSVFSEQENFTVHCGTEEIGSLTFAPPPGEKFALAGKVWEAEEIDAKKHLIFAKPAEGSMTISRGGPQSEIHTRILEKMQEVLCTKSSYPYLTSSCSERLEEIREEVKKYHLLENRVIRFENDRFVFFPWLGTKSFRTMKKILSKISEKDDILFDLENFGCFYFTFRAPGKTEKEVEDIIKKLARNVSLSQLVSPNETPYFDKFDSFLPRSLLEKSYKTNHLDLEEIQQKFS